MKFCVNCIADEELKAIIENINHLGTCEICNQDHQYIYDTDANDDLTYYFDDLTNIYTTKDDIPHSFPVSELFMLKDELNKNWNIFSNLTSAQIHIIITSILKEKYEVQPQLFNDSVALVEMHNSKYLHENALLKNNDWDAFVKFVKFVNRFHTDNINLELLSIFCGYIRKSYKKDAFFYRGRICNSINGYTIAEMSAPPIEFTTSGRANAEGIRCLYLANDKETTIHEVRAGAYDYITIGKFALNEDITVVNLKNICKISPFRIVVDNANRIDYTKFAVNISSLKKINEEISRVLLRSDSHLDYIPTQYICDYIKSISFDGIEYDSTMNKSGFNLAIFNPALFTCIETKTYRITNINYTNELI